MFSRGAAFLKPHTLHDAFFEGLPSIVTTSIVYS